MTRPNGQSTGGRLQHTNPYPNTCCSGYCYLRYLRCVWTFSLETHARTRESSCAWRSLSPHASRAPCAPCQPPTPAQAHESDQDPEARWGRLPPCAANYAGRSECFLHTKAGFQISRAPAGRSGSNRPQAYRNTRVRSGSGRPRGEVAPLCSKLSWSFGALLAHQIRIRNIQGPRRPQRQQPTTSTHQHTRLTRISKGAGRGWPPCAANGAG